MRLFEAGEVFEKLGDRHDEHRHLGFAATGDAIARAFIAGAQPYTFFHMKGDIEELLAAFQHQALTSTIKPRRTSIPAARRAR